MFVHRKVKGMFRTAMFIMGIRVLGLWCRGAFGFRAFWCWRFRAQARAQKAQYPCSKVVFLGSPAVPFSDYVCTSFLYKLTNQNSKSALAIMWLLGYQVIHTSGRFGGLGSPGISGFTETCMLQAKTAAERAPGLYARKLQGHLLRRGEFGRC